MNLFDTICFDVSAKAALHIIAGQLNEERDWCNSKLPESSLSWYKDLFLQDQIKQLRDVFMMIDGNGDGPLLRAVDCEICRICLVLCVHRFAEVFGTVSASDHPNSFCSHLFHLYIQNDATSTSGVLELTELGSSQSLCLYINVCGLARYDRYDVVFPRIRI